jgi:NAD(P)-dependent dehydrogenase (short-subunit alcohol dehydrogenase family)
LIDKTVERFGRLDVAVNTAGTEGVPGPITEQTADSYPEYPDALFVIKTEIYLA